MKPHPSIAAVLVLLLCISPVCMAQTSSDCQEIRDTIRALQKKTYDKDVSASVREINNKALADLYAQLLACIEREIKVIADISTTVAGTNAADGVNLKLRELRNEKATIEGQLARIGPTVRDPALGNGNGAPASDSMTRVNFSSPAPSDNSTTGTVDTVANAQATFPCLPAETYPDAPPLLTDIAGKAAADFVRDGGGVSGIPQMTLYATIDAASPTSSELLRGLEAYQYLSETARTDKQIGGAANSNGAVSAIEKPGFASLLGFAVEHGAINKKADGTNLTLSTSLYSLYVLNKENTAETYRRAGVLNRIGASATFAIDDTTDELANARRNNLSEWSVRARLFGDRSTRSKEFQKFWQTKINPLIDARLEAIGKPIEELTSAPGAPEDYNILRRQAGDCLRAAVASRTADADFKAATADERIKMVTSVLLSQIRSNIYNRVKTGQFQLGEKMITAIETRYVPNLRAALADLKRAGGEIEKKLEELKKSPLATFAYTNFRVPTASDYSETKFLFEQEKGFMRPLTLTGNVGLSVYHRPDRTLNQQRLRDVFAALSFEGQSDSPFTEAENRGKITYSFVGRYQRLFENRRVLGRTADIGNLQFITEIPLFRGLSLPFSVTYSTATEEEKKQGFRFNFGTRLDMDKLFELLRANSKF
ncbi:MAG TPA: hypothetical protein VGQ41_27665 [Pyrinomonadaceae bacterium]|nr:hypothetical protein [Pyrinomonadaceae bacterium]